MDAINGSRSIAPRANIPDLLPEVLPDIQI